MSEPMDAEEPHPGRVRTKQDFAGELTLLRQRAGLTVRQVAGKVGVQGAHSTVGDWFAGRGLPSPSSADLLVRVLRACRVDEPEQVEQWLQAWRRVRRSPGRRPTGPEPYRGLASFQPEDADWFFGRDALTAQLIARLAVLSAAGGGVQLVVGASGSGKSSLLRAGVIPQLRAGALPGSADRPIVLFTPGPHPIDELAAHLAAYTNVPPREMAQAMRADPGRCAEYARRAAYPVIVVDQFEELFTACDADTERRLFLAALAAAAADGALVVVGLRADFYAHALRYPRLVAAAQAGQLAVGPMSEAELREAIVGPAGKAGLDIEDGLVELLLRDVAPRTGGPPTGVLPLLSHALYATWRQGQGRRLTIADYRGVGGIEGAVAASAASVHRGLTGYQRELARRLFLCLVHVAADTADTRRRVGTDELFAELGTDPAELADVLDRFVAQRLVTVDAGTVEISHEALLTAWPQLRAWLDTDRAGLVVGRRLAEAAATWQRENRDPAALLRGGRLAAVQDWAEQSGPAADLSPVSREFLDASVQRELAERRAERRRTGRLRQLVAGLVVLCLLTAAAAGVAVRGLGTTQAQRDAALSAKVANEALALRHTDPALSAQLGLAAYRLTPTAEARGALLSTFATPYATRLTGHTGAAYDAEFSPDGRTLATAGTDRTVRLWDVSDRHRPTALATLAGHVDAVLAAVFSPDGHILATAGADGAVRLWQVGDPRRARELGTLTGHNGAVRRVAFSPDGQLLATAGADRTARLWDLRNPIRGSALATLTGHTDGLVAAVFSPDRRTLATTGSDRTVRLWDVADRRRPALLRILTGHTDRVLSAAFSLDGRILATGSFDNTLRLWQVADPAHAGPLTVLSGHSNGVVAIAFAADGHTVATGSYDLTVRLWDITDPRFAGAPVTLSGHAETVYSVAFSPDGATLASASRDTSVRLWDVRGQVLTGHTGPVNSAVLAPDGHTLVANSYRTSRLWDVTDPHRPNPLATLTGHTDGVLMAAFSRDSHTLATASLDGTARLWDLADPTRPGLLSTVAVLTGNVFSVALSQDASTVVTGDAGGAVRLWQLRDPRRPGPPQVLTGHGDRVLTVAVSPDGRMVASSSADRTVRLWDIANPRRHRPLATLTGHDNAVGDVAFSADGRTLATGSFDTTARLWDVIDPRHPRLLATLTGHSSGVNSVAFGPDGRTLATASFDHTVRLWDITDRRHPGPSTMLTGHTDRVTSVAFSPDGQTIVTAGTDATVRLWDTDITRAADRVCAVAHPRIARADWRRHFPELPYRPPCR